MKKEEFEFSKKKYLKAKNLKVPAFLLSLSFALPALTSCALATDEDEKVYKFTESQIANVNFKLPEEEMEKIISNFDLEFDPLDDTENEHNVISDKRFAEILEKVKQNAYDFTYDLYTLSEHLNLNTLKTRIISYYGSYINKNEMPIYNFASYIYENFKDFIDSNEKLSEKMLLKIKSTFEDVYFSNAEKIMKANFVSLDDLTAEEKNELIDVLYQSIRPAVYSFCLNNDYEFKLHSKAFSFTNYNMLYYSNIFFYGGQRLTADQIIEKIFNGKIWPLDYERLEEPIKNMWLEIADQEFQKRYGYKYTDCMELTNPDYNYNFVPDFIY